MIYIHLFCFLLVSLWRSTAGQKQHQQQQQLPPYQNTHPLVNAEHPGHSTNQPGVTPLPALNMAPVKRRPEADAAGFYGDTFSGGFGEFETMKRALPLLEAEKRFMLLKRRPEMGATGFHGDTFAQGFGEFDTMKRTPYAYWLENVAKRRPEMTKSGFHGDVFNGGFGEFHPMKK